MLNSLFSQQNLLCETFHIFKQDIAEILNTLLILKENNTHPNKANDCKEAPKPDRKVIDIDDDEAPTYAQKTTKKSNTSSHVLIVRDSHIHNLDRKVFENVTNKKVDIAIAYTVDNDNDARYPARNCP